MKSKVIETNKVEEFKPFTIQIMAESIQDARLLYHIFNRGNLRKDLNLGYEGYGDLICSQGFNGDSNIETFNKIYELITSQGFEI